MPRSKNKTKTLGKGSVVSCFARYIHPSEMIRIHYPNMKNNKRLENLIVTGTELRTIRNKPYNVVTLQCDEFMIHDQHLEVYVKFAKQLRVEEEGSPEFFFEEHVATPRANETIEFQPVSDEIFNNIVNRNSNFNPIIDDELAHLVNDVVEIDNDNDPAPENDVRLQSVDDDHTTSGWGHSGVCYRQMIGPVANKPTITDTISTSRTILDYFEILFPKTFLIDVILINVNKNVVLGEVMYGEFLRFLGIWFLIATIEGPSRRDFFSSSLISIFSGAPFRVNELMSRNRFEDILYSLDYTLNDPPAYLDRFFYIRDLQDAWNKNMHDNFSPGWACCLDESMMEWTSKYTCPGFMFVPRKPHPFGNEWHSICCGISGIMFAVELVEGKDRPATLKHEHEEKGKTVGLLLRLTKRLNGSGKVVILDSGFCVLKGIIELRKKGVFAAAVIKKRRYWPKYIDGGMVKEYFMSKEVGDVDSFGGCLDGIPYHIFCMKDEGYTTMLMSTYGTNERMGEAKRRILEKRQRQQIHFKYPEVVSNHYRFRHAVDDHNAKRHSPISFERVWGTKLWKDRIFAFLIAVTEVNCRLAYEYFNNKEFDSTLAFRKLFAQELINNQYYINEQADPGERVRRSARLNSNTNHELLSIPPGKKFLDGKIVDSITKYALAKCSTCKKRTRSYCRCTPGVRLCTECYAIHIASTAIMD